MRRRLALVLCAVVTPLAACDFDFQGNDGDASSSAEQRESPATVVTTPPTPFCAAVAELERRVDESSTDSDRPIIVEAYTEMLDLVPTEVLPDFEAVLADLREGGASTVPTTAPIVSVDLDAPTGTDATPASTVLPGSTVAGTQVFEEGYAPDDTPSARIGAYIDFACDRSENNPGPPATQPDQPVPGTTTP